MNTFTFHKLTITFYYAIGLVAFAIMGFRVVGPDIGFAPMPLLSYISISIALLVTLFAIFAARKAKRQNAPLELAHCLWISTAFGKALLVGLGALLVNVLLRTLSNSARAGDAFVLSTEYILNCAVPYALVWFAYNMIFGLFSLIKGRTPQG